MSVRPSLYSYVNPKGDLYIKTTGGKPIEFSDKFRVIKSIDPNQQKKIGGGIFPKLFPHEASNRPPLSNVFQSREGSHLSEKEVPVKRTGIYWMKNEFVRKAQSNVIEPNSVVQMKNQVLNDGFPQNPGLAHNNKSQEFQMERIKAQIEKLRRLGEIGKADELMRQYFPNEVMINNNQVMIGELGQVVREIANLRAAVVAGGGGVLGGGGGGVLGGGGVGGIGGASLSGIGGLFGSPAPSVVSGSGASSVSSVSASQAAIEAKFDELIKMRAKDLFDEIQRVRKEKLDEIDALEEKGDPVPPELLSFKQKFDKFNQADFQKKFPDGNLPIDPKKLNKANKEVIENLSRFLAGKALQGTAPGSRRGSTSSTIETTESMKEEKKMSENITEIAQKQDIDKLIDWMETQIKSGKFKMDVIVNRISDNLNAVYYKNRIGDNPKALEKHIEESIIVGLISIGAKPSEDNVKKVLNDGGWKKNFKKSDTIIKFVVDNFKP